MRSIWKGAVSFGLVTIPIKLFSATEEHDVPLHQVHVEDGSRIRYKRVCESEGVEVAYSEIARGYQLPDGDTVVLTSEDLASLPIASSRTIDVMRFVPADQIDPVYLNKSYYLQADGPGKKPYVLLRQALSDAGTYALVKVALRQRESLAVLRAVDDVLVLQTMLWPDEIRDASGLAPDEDIEIRPQELSMAASYIDTLTGDFEPDEFSDEYASALRAVVEAKVAGREVTQVPEPAGQGAEVIDLMAALEASVAEAKKARGAAPAGRSTTAGAAKKAPAKKAAPAKSAAKKAAPAKKAATKAAEKKTAAKKAPAKKTAARKRTA
jgi:DNA end-binding protein Ku